MSDEKRRYPRWQVFYLLRAFERGSDNLLGHVIDIGEAGVCLGSERRLEPESTLALWMQLPFEDGKPGRLQFDARVAWARESEQPGLWEHGLEITGMLPRARLVIEDFIEELEPAH